MANYNAVKQSEDDAGSNHSLSPPLQHAARSDDPDALFLDHQQDKLDSDHEHNHHHGPSIDSGLAGLVKKVRDLSPPNKSYEMLENDDFTAPMSPTEPLSPRTQNTHAQNESRQLAPIKTSAPDESFSLGELAKAMRSSMSDGSRSAHPKSPIERTVSPEPMMRSASGRNIKLRHPSPGLQSLQGAYVGNIVNLEKSAERLSMTSDIAESIRRMSMELKRSDSRRSSILAATVDAIDIPTRQFSNNSIVEMNSAARNGGYSPGGFMMSPRSSMSGPIATRSASKSSKYSRPEPEQEGRPLDSIVTVSAHDQSRKSSLVEEESTTFTKDVMAAGGLDDQRPTTSASTNTFDQSRDMFMDFDGVHCAPSSRGPPDNAGQQRMSVGNRLSAHTQSFADPASGQQMVYYPAPVPTMLNLPQKLSKNTGGGAVRDKRRSQVMSTIPPQARQSAIWLPDVLETDDDARNESVENMEYMPQHQRRSMGGRQTMNDMEHIPPQLRAGAYFEYPSLSQDVELKGDSVTATLDSILDASASAPVSAFTDHAFGGQLGKEVYGRAPQKNSNSTSNFLAPPKPEPKKKEKRRSSFMGLLRRSSSADLLETEKRISTVPSLSGSRQPRLSAEENGEESEAQEEGLLDGEDGIHPQADENGQLDEEVYTGPPTTLLAELQLRKQQQKMRTRPLTDVYANGVHSTLLEMEAVAQVQQKARQKKQVNLAWEQGIGAEDDDDDDVPLGLLYAGNAGANAAPVMRRADIRPFGLLEQKHMEDNEPLSRRRERLTGGRSPRAASMLALPNLLDDDEEEGETLAQRVKRLKAAGGTATGLPSSRRVSGAFASEMMSQLGVDAAEPDSKRTSASVTPLEKGAEKESPIVAEEEETLGQRRKRLQAEKEAREQEVGSGMLGAVLEAGGAEQKEERPVFVKQNSLSNILSQNPVGPYRTGSQGNIPTLSQEKGRGAGLLGAQERKDMRRASTLAELQKENHRVSRHISAGDGGEALRNKDVKVGGLLGMRDEMRHSSLGLGIAPPQMGMGINPQARHSTMTFATQQQFGGISPYGNQAAMRSTMSFGPTATVGMGYGMPVQTGFQQPYSMNGMGYGQNMNMMGGYAQPAYGQQMYGGQMYGYPQQNMMAPAGMQTGGVIEEGKGKDMVERWRQSIMP